jgi:hypothetical protein
VSEDSIEDDPTVAEAIPKAPMGAEMAAGGLSRMSSGFLRSIVLRGVRD